MGGYGAMKLALSAPDYFGAAASLSGGLDASTCAKRNGDAFKDIPDLCIPVFPAMVSGALSIRKVVVKSPQMLLHRHEGDRAGVKGEPKRRASSPVASAWRHGRPYDMAEKDVDREIIKNVSSYVPAKSLPPYCI